MSTIRRRRLQLDDPLTPSHPSAPHPQPADPMPPGTIQHGRAGADALAPKPRRRGNAAGTQGPTIANESKPSAPPTSDNADGGIWREWSGITAVGSFRLPHELLVELGATAREQGLPIGMIVTAAVTRVLDQPPETIAALVDRADDARIEGRRRSRRCLTTRSDD
jgi:hypothetical protein